MSAEGGGGAAAPVGLHDWEAQRGDPLHRLLLLPDQGGAVPQPLHDAARGAEHVRQAFQRPLRAGTAPRVSCRPRP